MYRCDCCGYIFAAPDDYREYQGECHGYPAYETLNGCPCCGGGYQQIEEA